MSKKVVRLILTFVNPKAVDLKNLQTVLQESVTLTESRLYVASPERNLINYAAEPKEIAVALQTLQTLQDIPKAPSTLGASMHY